MARADASGMISRSAWAAARALRTSTQRDRRARSEKVATDSAVDHPCP